MSKKSLLLMIGYIFGFAPHVQAADIAFYDAQRSCQTKAEPHDFHIDFNFTKNRHSTYRIEPETAFTQCLNAAASIKDADGTERIFSLGADIDRVAEQCSKNSNFPQNFSMHFSLTSENYFSAHMTGAKITKVESCFALMLGLAQPFTSK